MENLRAYASIPTSMLFDMFEKNGSYDLQMELIDNLAMRELKGRRAISIPSLG